MVVNPATQANFSNLRVLFSCKQWDPVLLDQIHSHGHVGNIQGGSPLVNRSNAFPRIPPLACEHLHRNPIRDSCNLTGPY